MKTSNILICLFAVVLSCLCPVAMYGEDGETAVKLEADKIVYNQSSNIAEATGNVKVQYGNLRLFAPLLEMDSAGRSITVTSVGTEMVTMLYGDRRITGDKLEYNLDTKEGFMTNAKTSSAMERGNVYLYGDRVDVVPAERAHNNGWLSGRDARSVSEDELVGRWENSSVTTCPKPNPHYRLVTRELVLIPGKKVIARSPEVYIGTSRLFKYPFDYVVRLDANARESHFFPTFTYDSDKGYGIGLSGPFVWDDGKIDLSVLYWSDIDFEWSAVLEQKIGDISLFAATAYEYNDAEGEKLYRPSWGAKYEHLGWEAKLLWSQREYIDMEKKAGSTFKGTLWREPELYFSSPWYRDGVYDNSFYRIFGTWGCYSENSESTDRLGGGIEIYGWTGNEDSVRPFWKGRYAYYDYDTDGFDQKITEMALGARWRLGRLALGSAYVRRWVSGSSPMEWDDFSDDEMEELYQQLSIPFSTNLALTLRGAYDLEDSVIDEMVYKISLDNNCCMSWELAYRDDRSSDDDDWAGLKLIIKAFPNEDLRFGEHQLYDPFEAPEGLDGK